MRVCERAFPTVLIVFASAAAGRSKNIHVERTPEKDDKKEKQTARKMITMARAINHDHFDGHRDAHGLKIPFRWTVARPSGRFSIQIDESRQNVPVDDKTFEKAPQGPPS